MRKRSSGRTSLPRNHGATAVGQSCHRLRGRQVMLQGRSRQVVAAFVLTGPRTGNTRSLTRMNAAARDDQWSEHLWGGRQPGTQVPNEMLWGQMVLGQARVLRVWAESEKKTKQHRHCRPERCGCQATSEEEKCEEFSRGLCLVSTSLGKEEDSPARWETDMTRMTSTAAGYFDHRGQEEAFSAREKEAQHAVRLTNCMLLSTCHTRFLSRIIIIIITM